MDIQTLASILVTLHIVSGIFIGMVLKRQWGLFKHAIEDGLSAYRKVFFTLSLIIFLGNLNPIVIDVKTILTGPGGRPAHVSAISISYAVSNALVAVISSFLVYMLYRMASDWADKLDKD